MTGRISVAPAVAGRTILMRVSPVGPTGQTVSSICASRSGIGCDCKSVRTLCASAGLSWLSGGPLRPSMNACAVGSSAIQHLLFPCSSYFGPVHFRDTMPAVRFALRRGHWRKPLAPTRRGEEVDKQLVDAFTLVVMHPVRGVGQALNAVEVGYVSVVGLGEFRAEVGIALAPNGQCAG